MARGGFFVAVLRIRKRKVSKRKNKSRVEKLLDEVRRKPSPFCDDPRQLDLEGAVTQRAFANLDLEIERVLSASRQNE